MTEHVGLRLRRSLRSVRVHVVPADEAVTPRVRWLLDLETRVEAERIAREASQRALESFALAIADAVGEIPKLVTSQLRQVADSAVELGLALAREVVGTAIERGFADPTEAVLRCLEHATHGASGATVQIFVAPEDLALISQRFADAPELAAAVQDAEFVADPGLERGAVRIETRAGSTRWSPAELIEQVCAEAREAITA